MLTASWSPFFFLKRLSSHSCNHHFVLLLMKPNQSADLTGSNLTRWKSAEDFQPTSTKLGSYAGRYLRYGVREHGMGAIMNGLAAYGKGLVIPSGGTFLNFVSCESTHSPYQAVQTFCLSVCLSVYCRNASANFAIFVTPFQTPLVPSDWLLFLTKELFGSPHTVRKASFDMSARQSL